MSGRVALAATLSLVTTLSSAAGCNILISFGLSYSAERVGLIRARLRTSFSFGVWCRKTEALPDGFGCHVVARDSLVGWDILMFGLSYTGESELAWSRHAAVCSEMLQRYVLHCTMAMAARLLLVKALSVRRSRYLGSATPESQVA